MRIARVIYGNDSSLSKQTTLVEKTIRMKDGKHKTLFNREYIDKRLQKVSDHFEHAETYQAIHRKRLVWGSEPKRVVYCSNYVQDITVSRTITFESLVKGQLQFEDFITNNGIWKHNDSKGMSTATDIPSRTITDLKNEPSPKYEVVSLDVREIKSRKKTTDMKFLVSTDLLNGGTEEFNQKIESIGYKIIS